MMTTTAGGVAAGILRRGVELDTAGRYTEALICYQEGLQIIIDDIKKEADDTKKKYLRQKIEEYMNRGEILKRIINEKKESGAFHEQIRVENNSTGHSFKSLFGRFLDSEVIYVLVEDPYVRTFHQIQNFVRLCELLVRTCTNLNKIELLTSKETRKNSNEKDEWKACLSKDLNKYKVNLIVKYSETLHDRQIILSTGWIIKIGRGLDFYKPPENKFCLGVHDMDLRQCHETVVDIVHSSNVKKSFG